MSRQERSLVPAGMTTILPHVALQVRRLEGILLTQLRRWGYDEIILPTFEYLDVLAPGLEQDIIEKCYQFADRTTGRILLLRPDATAQIARTVAMGMIDRQIPLRLSYRTSVFRYEPEHAGRDREIFQVGAELIGRDDIAADAEIIALMAECLKQVGLRSFKVSLGHVGFFKGLLAGTGMSADGRKRAEQAAARKDLPRLEEILSSERVPLDQARSILEAPGLYGREEVLDRGRRLAGRDRTLQSTLDRLTQVHRLLESAGLRDYLLLDLGEFRGFEYYDGLVFDVFADGVGCELGGGGRYDHLIGRFGRDLPSTGFALDVDRLFRALSVDNAGEIVQTGPDYVVCAPARLCPRLFQVTNLLRARGCRVIHGTVRKHPDETIETAVEELRRYQATAALVLGAPGFSSDEVMMIENLSSGPAAKRSRKSRSKAHSFKRVKIQALADLVGRTASS
jgi:ATP phosphoribosyltransferase regulatory subunit